MDITLFFIGLGLAMDAFSVSVSDGSCVEHAKPVEALKVGLFFGIAQGIMPIIGFFTGQLFASFVESVDHWIAFVILTIIGTKMIIECMEKSKTPEACRFKKLSFKDLFFQAIATSIDALAVGIGFAALDINIWISSFIIFLITLILSFLGFFIGKNIGKIFKEKAEIFGGFVLILIGAKILIEHLFF